MSISLNNTEDLVRSYQDDIVNGIFKIHLDRPVTELGNQFCRYYFATNIETEREYFAIVFERSFNPSIKTFALLKKFHNPFLNQIIDYSLVKLSTGRKYHVAAICNSYNPENSLRKYVESNGGISNSMIDMTLLPTLVKVIEFCNTHKLSCGNINPDNLIFSNDGKLFLREFIDSPQNFYQKIPYLAPELSDLLPNARISRNLSGDIYAVGMTTYYALNSLNPLFHSTDNSKLMNASRIENGTYHMANVKNKISTQFRTFLASTLQDNVSTRWTANIISQWFLSKDRGSKFKAHADSPNSSGHTILFEGRNYSNPFAIASAMYVLYEKGIRFCYNESFAKWIQKVKGKADHIDDLFKTRISTGIFSNIIDSEKEEMFMKVLHALDGLPYVRLRDFCITIESIPDLLFSSIYNGNSALFDNISKLLRRNYWKMVMTNDLLREYPQEYIDILTKLTSTFVANSSESSGKQAMYSLDPYIPCMSPSVINDYALTISDLLLALDKVAAHTPNKLSIDDHIVSFITSRLGTEVISNSKINLSASQFEGSIVVRGIGLLAIAQEYTHDIKIPHLATLVAQKLIEWANDNLHSTKLRKVITSEIAELAGNGDLASMLYVISNPKLFHNDNRGYKAAYRQTTEITNDIKLLSDSKRVTQLGIILGQRLTVLFAYLLCMIVALILIV